MKTVAKVINKPEYTHYETIDYRCPPLQNFKPNLKKTFNSNQNSFRANRVLRTTQFQRETKKESELNLVISPQHNTVSPLKSDRFTINSFADDDDYDDSQVSEKFNFDYMNRTIRKKCSEIDSDEDQSKLVRRSNKFKDQQTIRNEITPSPLSNSVQFEKTRQIPKIISLKFDSSTTINIKSARQRNTFNESIPIRFVSNQVISPQGQQPTKLPLVESPPSSKNGLRQTISLHVLNKEFGCQQMKIASSVIHSKYEVSQSPKNQLNQLYGSQSSIETQQMPSLQHLLNSNQKRLIQQKNFDIGVKCNKTIQKTSFLNNRRRSNIAVILKKNFDVSLTKNSLDAILQESLKKFRQIQPQILTRTDVQRVPLAMLNYKKRPQFRPCGSSKKIDFSKNILHSS